MASSIRYLVSSSIASYCKYRLCYYLLGRRERGGNLLRVRVPASRPNFRFGKVVSSDEGPTCGCSSSGASRLKCRKNEEFKNCF